MNLPFFFSFIRNGFPEPVVGSSSMVEKEEVFSSTMFGAVAPRDLHSEKSPVR